MGRKQDLSDSTKSYMNKVCQPTIQKICDPGKVWPRIGTDWERVREDLWYHSNIPIGDRNRFAQPAVAP